MAVEINFFLIDSQGCKFSGNVKNCYIGTPDGEIGILPDHESYLSLTTEGLLTVNRGFDETKFFVERGIVFVEKNIVKVVVEEVKDQNTE
ncbi:MAG: hypothetical protein NZO16_06300 [Deltaproteobacteria bacterium]|nr:hypothetical protein [Deltaproteobacteria bacterium]